MSLFVVRFSLLALFVTCFGCSGLAQDWFKTSAPGKQWLSIACSADASNVIAAATFDPTGTNLQSSLWVSGDSGKTWTSNTAPVAAWTYVSCSADGTHLFAFGNGDSGFFISTNNGSTWTKITPATCNCTWGYVWTHIASSGDGTGLLVGGLYISDLSATEQAAVVISGDGGLTWSAPIVVGDYGSHVTGVASGADGNRLAVVSSAGLLVISTNGGAAWTTNLLSTDSSSPFYSIAGSVDGGVLLTTRYSSVASMKGAFVTTNGASTWIGPSIPGAMPAACSAEGRRLVVADSAIHISDDFGNTWSPGSVQLTNVTALASSADGTRIFAAAAGDGIYVKQSSAAPALSSSYSGGHLQLSWLLPSQTYDLQQSLSLNPPHWTNSPASTRLNFTNLHEEVSTPAQTGAAFYRLALQ